MLKHNLLIIYRSFLRNKTSFVINIAGLTAGLACALFIVMWVEDELKMDAFHEDHVYQVMQQVPMVDGVMVADWSPGPLAQALEDELPEVELAISAKMTTQNVFDGVISFSDTYIKARPHFADPEFFQVFSYPLIHGTEEQVLRDPYSIVISETLALALFGSTSNAIGETVQWEKKIGEIVDFSRDFTVTGVFDAKAEVASDDFDVVFTFAFFLEKNPQTNEWFNDQATTYVLLQDNADIEALNDKITTLVGDRREAKHGFFLQKYSSRYLYNNFENGQQAGGRIEYLWLFSVIAILILAIASINFMNLSTAKASLRMREIGTKKTIGATRQQLIVQFVTESVIISLVAFVLAAVLVILLLPQFNAMTGKQLVLDLEPQVWILFVSLALLTGLFSSIYPALYLSNFNPIQVLKGKVRMSFGEVWIRKALVVFQFSVSVVLIVFVLVIFRQMSFINTKNLGYDRDNVISVQKEGALDQNLENFLAEVSKLTGVVNATNSSGKLFEANNFTWGIDWPGREPEEYLQINPFMVNYGYLETFDIKLVAGRSFSEAFGNEGTKVILNESAVEAMGLVDPVGTILTIWNEEVEVIGIAEDFHFQSLYQSIAPCFFKLFPEGNNYGAEINIKIRAGAESETIEQIAGVFNTYNPGYPFEFRFVDDEYQSLYESESRTATLSRLFSGLAIFISCMGLFGLAAFTAERRTKEIGLRKILGAGIWNIIALLTGDFARMILFAIVLALPVSFFVARRWLEGFTYSVGLEWWYFAGAAFLVLLIAGLTVSYQTLKASMVNPVQSLRYE